MHKSEHPTPWRVIVDRRDPPWRGCEVRDANDDQVIVIGARDGLASAERLARRIVAAVNAAEAR